MIMNSVIHKTLYEYACTYSLDALPVMINVYLFIFFSPTFKKNQYLTHAAFPDVETTTA